MNTKTASKNWSKMRTSGRRRMYRRTQYNGKAENGR